MNTNHPQHPQWIIKFLHNSKRNTVKIVDWEYHHEVALIHDVYTYNGEDSDGKKAAELIAAAPELLQALKSALAQLEHTNQHTPIGDMEHTKNTLRDAIAKVTPAE